MTEETLGFTFIADEELPQRSPEWREWRATLGTATQAAVIMGEPYKPKRKKEDTRDAPQTWDDLRRIRVFGEVFEGNAATEYGANLEDEALASFNGNAAQDAFAPICAERRVMGNANTRIGASYDGYHFNERDGRHEWVEIKCPYTGTKGDLWRSMLDDIIPRHYYWQLVHQALVLDLAGGTVPPQGYFFVYVPDEEPLCTEVNAADLREDMDRLEDQWYAFLKGGLQPGDMTQNPAFRVLEQHYIEAKSAADTHRKTADELRKQMIGMYEDEAKRKNVEAPRIIGDHLNIDRTVSMRVDLAAFRRDNPKLDLTPWETETRSWTVRVKPGK